MIVWVLNNLGGLTASLGCLLITALSIAMVAEMDRPRADRGWEQAESVRGLFDDRSKPAR